MLWSVKEQFRPFNERFEGLVSFMYLDVKGLVTIGMGNLIDPIQTTVGLPFRYRRKPGQAAPGALASRAEIEDEWRLIKGKVELAKLGHRACDPLTNLELDSTAIDQLIVRKVTQNEAFMKRQRAASDFDNWPADAQLGLLSMAWALGPGFLLSWPKFRGACEDGDFSRAADNCRMSEVGNPGVHKRNLANERLFRNAAAVIAGEADGFYQRSTLYYPTVLLPPIDITSE